MFGKFRSKLGLWKGKFLSPASRLCLIKYVLTSLPLLYMLVYCKLTIVMKEVERIQKNFLWGWGSEEDYLGGME